jgi:hypothetical protein
MAKRTWMFPALAIAGALALAFPSRAQTAAATAAIDPAAMAALDKMGAYPRTPKVFRVESRTARDEVLANGQKIQREGTTAAVWR